MKFLIQTPSNSLFLPFKYVPFTQKLTTDENMMINFLRPDIKIFCDQCLSIIDQEDISIFVESVNQEKDKKVEKDYCVRCFCSYLKSNGKLSDSKMVKGLYFVRNPGVYCLTSTRWKVTDDLLLLQAIKKFGYGNWNKMAYQMETHECHISVSQYKKHFLTYFYEEKNQSNIIFQRNKEFLMKDSSDQYEEKENAKPNQKKKVNAKQISDHFLQWKETKSMGKQKNSMNMELIKSQVINSLERQDSQQFTDQNLEGENVLMYIPERDQFLIDHDPYAQSLISNLEFNDEDCEQEIGMKERLLLAYNQKLKERKKRKMLAVNHNLVRTLAQSQNKNSNKQVFFLNKSPQQQITAFLDPFFRLFRDQQEIKITKTLITNHYNVKEILGTLCWVKKNANVKLSTFKSLEAILKSTIQNQQDDNKQQSKKYRGKGIQSKKVMGYPKETIYEDKKFIKPLYEQKLIFIQTEIDKSSSVSPIYQFKFDTQLNKPIKQKNDVNSRRNTKIQK